MRNKKRIPKLNLFFMAENRWLERMMPAAIKVLQLKEVHPFAWL